MSLAWQHIFVFFEVCRYCSNYRLKKSANVNKFNLIAASRYCEACGYLLLMVVIFKDKNKEAVLEGKYIFPLIGNDKYKLESSSEDYVLYNVVYNINFYMFKDVRQDVLYYNKWFSSDFCFYISSISDDKGIEVKYGFIYKVWININGLAEFYFKFVWNNKKSKNIKVQDDEFFTYFESCSHCGKYVLKEEWREKHKLVQLIGYKICKTSYDWHVCNKPILLVLFKKNNKPIYWKERWDNIYYFMNSNLKGKNDYQVKLMDSISTVEVGNIYKMTYDDSFFYVVSRTGTKIVIWKGIIKREPVLVNVWWRYFYRFVDLTDDLIIDESDKTRYLKTLYICEYREKK